MPATSERQRRAAGSALSAKRKGSSKDLGGASRSMYESMTESELADYASKEADKRVMAILKSIDIYIDKEKERCFE